MTTPHLEPNRPSPEGEETWDSRGRFRPLVFGEALFDHFPDGSRVLGGAPFNVAWHLRGFKTDPLMVSGVGEDPEGKEILDRMASWGMARSGIQVHPTRPTGKVTAHLDGDQPSYDIEPEQAYDAVGIDGLPPEADLRRTALLYHGSLGLREATAARTLIHLKKQLGTPVFVDVNLRDPWWSPQGTHNQIRGADWVKVNLEEASRLAGLPTDTEAALLETAGFLKQELDIKNLVVTMGEDGAWAFTEDGVTRQRAVVVADIVDTVGAGDGFSSVLALGIHGRWPVSLTLRRASEFAGELCRIRGAIPDDSDLYLRYLRRWDHAE
ncbi:MAG: carbohydrate kinase [Gemmatimonadetes bacterium]|nr:carbohydrate kinase [Gemmatimonadota bacterium]NNM04985.1 carbohydrate kinase [Gemmatimonadota bacterium]